MEMQIDDSTVQAIQHIKFEIKRKINPSRVRPKRNHYFSFPMEENVWDKIFPYSTQLNIKAKPSIKYKRYVRIKKIKFNSVVELNDLFGPSWYITHVGSDMGCTLGQYTFD